MTHMPQISRRFFLTTAGAAGGGLALGFHLPGGTGEAAAAPGPAEVNAWVVIQPDDAVIIRVARSEMGQGITTALPMLVAEELQCDWSKVRAEFPSPEENLRRKRAWGDMSTGGSRSVRTSQEYLRKAGAAAREMLIAAAAAQWGVPAAECQAANSIVTHKPSGRTLRYGEVADAAAKQPPPSEVKLKDPKDWSLLGTPQKRLDTVDKVTGKPLYGIDARVPNMVYAAIAQCPVFGGTPKSFDEVENPRAERRAPGGAAAERGRRGCRQLVAGKDGHRRAAGDLGRGTERYRVERQHRRVPARRAYRAGGGGGPQGRRCRCGARHGREAGRGRIWGAVSEPCDDGAAELHGLRHP